MERDREPERKAIWNKISEMRNAVLGFMVEHMKRWRLLCFQFTFLVINVMLINLILLKFYYSIFNDKYRKCQEIIIKAFKRHTYTHTWRKKVRRWLKLHLHLIEFKSRFAVSGICLHLVSHDVPKGYLVGLELRRFIICSRFCWKRLQRNLGLIRVVDSPFHVKLRPLNTSWIA